MHMRSLSFVLLSLAISYAAAGNDQPSSAAKDPEFEAQFRQGQEAMKAGKYKEAIDALKKAGKLHEKSCPSCYYALALAYIHTGQLQEAIHSCDVATATSVDDPGRAAAHSLKGSVLLGSAGGDNKKLAAAEQEERAAVQLDGAKAPYHLSLAQTLLKESKDSEAKEELLACLALNPDPQTAEQTRQLLADPRRGREEFAPDFEVTTQQGQQVSLKNLAGRIVVMDFWATWCPPCRESVPELKELTRKYSHDKLVLISVSADSDDQAWSNFIARKSMDWAQYRDADHKILGAFHIHAFPTYLVIDGDGIIRQRIVGLNPRESVVYRLKTTLEHMPQLEGEARK